MILLLTISTLVVLSASNSNFSPIFLNSPQNNIGISTKSYSGSGTQLNATLYITNTYNNTPNATNTISNIYVPSPSGWEILRSNLTLSNITAPNTTLASNYTTTNATLDLSNLTAMSFQLTNNAYLDNISAQLNATNPPPTANFYVYSAANNGGKPIPLLLIASNTSGISIPSGNTWVNASFGHQFLNISTTYNNTFFIGIWQSSGPKAPLWNAVQESSPPGNGYVYNNTGSSWVEVQNYDCQLVVNVSASNNTPADSAFPSEIGLTINGSPVQNSSKGNGVWINSTATSGTNGYVFYDVNSTWMSTVSFSYIWNITMSRNASVSALTNFYVSLNTGASWNITVNAAGSDGFPLTNGANHINITGTPSDWNFTNSMVYNVSGSQWINLDSRPPDNISFTAGNGTWIVNCTAPNYVSSIGFWVGGVPVANATLYDNLNITVNFAALVNGSANLSIYDSFQILNHTEVKTVTSSSSTWFTWNVSNNATSTGPYNVTISFKDGSVVGYNETSLLIVPLTNTSLAVTSYPPNVEYPGPVPITLYYNNTDNNSGVAGATITAYFTNSTSATIQGLITDYGNGTYSLNLNFSTDIGILSVKFNASNVRLFNSSVSSPIQVNYTQALVSIQQLSTPSSVPLGTSLVVEAQLLYNSSGLPVAVGETVYFNFSVRFGDNSSTILPSSGPTNSTGWAKGTIQVPSNAVELNVTAYYIGKTTVSGATSSTNSVTLTSAPVNPPDTGLAALMFLILTQQNQNSLLYPILGVVIGSVVAVFVITDRARRKHEVPLKALASLENIIVDHILSGVTIWAFDFLKMEQDAVLVSGFMSAVKSFLGEMKKGGLRKLETEFGTFIREDGELLTVTCITSGSTQEEEKWIREKLHSFVATAEQQNWDRLVNWSGEVSHFRSKFLKTLSSLIDLEKAEQLQREKVLKILKERERLQAELNNLGSKLETLNQQLSGGIIGEGEFEARRTEIEPKYDKIQMDYVRASILLSKIPYTLETVWETPKTHEEIEKIRDKFIEITMEIDSLQRKEQIGRISSKELKHKENLRKELTALIEKLDKRQAE